MIRKEVETYLLWLPLVFDDVAAPCKITTQQAFPFLLRRSPIICYPAASLHPSHTLPQQRPMISIISIPGVGSCKLIAQLFVEERMLESVQATVYVKWHSSSWNEVQTLKLILWFAAGWPELVQMYNQVNHQYVWKMVTESHLLWQHSSCARSNCSSWHDH